MGEELERDLTILSRGPSRESSVRLSQSRQLTLSVDFKGDCSLKTGPDGSKFGADYVDYLARSFETQTWVYETAGSGYIQWTWKTEEASDWSMSTGITYGEFGASEATVGKLKV